MVETKTEKLENIKPDLTNANRHTERGNAMLRQSMQKFGFAEAGTLDAHNRIIGGNHRTEVAADVLGSDEAIVIDVDGTKPVYIRRADIDLSTPQGRELAYALNRVAQVSIDFDPEVMLSDIQQGVNLDDMFRQDEIDTILAEIAPPMQGEDTEPEISRAEELKQEWGTELGQLWALGEHRLICGDCTDEAIVKRVMGGKLADIEIHDPPYGMRLDTDWSGAKSRLTIAAQKGILGGKSYKRVEGDFEDYDPTFLLDRSPLPKELFLWGADYYAERIPNKNDGSWLIWDKRIDESADKMYGSCFETCWSMKKHKRDFIRVKWAGVFGSEAEPERMRFHPTQKPVLVYEWLLQKYSSEGDITSDYYLGAGSHLIAAQNLNRRCRAIEIDPGYVAVTLQRFLDHTGIKPELTNTQ